MADQDYGEPVEIKLGVYRVDRPTPNGGAYSIGIFSDEAGNLVPKEQARHAEFQEFTADGENIMRTYGTFDPPE